MYCVGCSIAWRLGSLAWCGPGAARAFNQIHFCLGDTQKIWMTPSFRQKHPWETLLLLELLSACPNRWTVLSTAQEWATAKALADVQKRPAEVIALVSLQHDVVGNAKHCFDLDQFLLFVCNAQPGKGSIGLLGM